MSNQVFYSGPGKVFYTIPGVGTVIGFQPEGADGQISMSLDEKTTTRGAAMYGDLLETLDDQTGKISVVPFDTWTLLPALFPPYLGVTTAAPAPGAGVGALAIGTQPHDPTGTGTNNSAAGVFTPDGRLYKFVRCAITKHPAMKLGAGEKLFGSTEISCLGNINGYPAADPVGGSSLFPGNPTSGFLMAAQPVTEIGAIDPDTIGFGNSVPTNFAQSHWTGAWAGGQILSGNPFTTMEAENGWDLVPDVRYSTITVQKLTRVMKLVSARFMIKARIVGVSHTNLVATILAHQSGGILSEVAPNGSGAAQALILTGNNGKTITLNNAEPKTAPFSFGGTSLNTGEIGWVSTITITAAGAGASAATPNLMFSA